MNKSLDFAMRVSILRYLSRSDGNYQIKKESASIYMYSISLIVIEGTGVEMAFSAWPWVNITSRRTSFSF